MGLAAFAIATPSLAADPARYMTAELVGASPVPAPGSTTLSGIRFSPKPGWDGYWSNPGDSGIAPTVDWDAPAGVSFGPLLHPPPDLLTAAGMTSFVHERRHVLLARMSIAGSIERGTAIPVIAKLSWAACTATQCVPLHATLRLQLVAGDGAKGDSWPELRDAAAKLPQPAPPGDFVRDGQTIRLFVPARLKLNPRSVRFFADRPGLFDTAAAEASFVGGALAISGPAMSRTPDSISGLLSDGRLAYRLRFVPRPASRGKAMPRSIVPAPPSRSPPSTEQLKQTALVEQRQRQESSDRPSRNSSLPLVALAAAMVAVGIIIARRR